MAVGIEERADSGQVGQEKIVDEINVQRTSSNVLKKAPHPRHMSKVLVIVAEIHENHGEQRETCQRQRDDGPGHA